ncbi:hypothetical protein ACWC4D_33760 [Streptomyces sp. NPDC001288]
MNPAYEPLVRKVTSVGCDMTTDEAVKMLDDLTHALAQQIRDVDFGWYEDDAAGAERARDHLADLIDPHVDTL